MASKSDLGSEKKEEILAKAQKRVWFHAIQLGDRRTAGRFPEGQPQNTTLYGVMDLLKDVDVSGKRCLDIGTVNGITAFNMASRGGSVVATDIFPQKDPGFALVQEYLELEVDYRTEVDFSNILDKLPKHSFDVVVCAGVLYHMLNPFDSILKCRSLLKRDGILVFESAFLPDAEGAYLDFNPMTQSMKEIYTYWMPSEGAMFGMLRFAGFNILATRTVRHPDRIAFICTNGDLDQVSDRTDIMKRLHETGIQDPTFPAPPPESSASSAKFTGELSNTTINWRSYTPDFFPHPNKDVLPLGKTVWLSEGGNF